MKSSFEVECRETDVHHACNHEHNRLEQFSNEVIGTENPRKLTLALLNCRSIRSEEKSREFEIFLREHNPDVVMGTESWLSADISDAEVFPQNYIVYRKDRNNKKGGGVFICVRDNITSYKEDWNSSGNCEAVWCRIVDKYQKHYLVGCFYDPPSDCHLHLSEFLSHCSGGKGTTAKLKNTCWRRF